MPATDPALPDDAAALFRIRPEGFVAARDELVGRLRDAGRDADAAAVKSLRKPTVVLWALNQLVVRDGERVRTLLDAGTELRAAQQATLSSPAAADRLREAAAARRHVIEELVRVARQALEEEGRGTGGQADQVATALETASIDPVAGGRLAAGTLVVLPAEPAGFGEVFGLAGLPAVLPGGLADDRDLKTAAPATDLRSRKAEVARLRRERDATEKAARAHRAAAVELARELDAARERLGAVAAAHADAAARASASELGAARAKRAYTKAAERLDRREPNR